MSKPVIKPKIILKAEPKSNLPQRNSKSGKVDWPIKDISRFNELEKSFYKDVNKSLERKLNPNLKANLLPNQEKEYLAHKKKIWKVQEDNRNSRAKKLLSKFNLNESDLMNYITKKYPNIINVGIFDNAQLNKAKSIPHALSFKWRFNKELNVVHLFEWHNQYGLNSKNPIYRIFKEESIKKLKEQAKEHGFNKSTKFVVDSEVIDN